MHLQGSQQKCLDRVQPVAAWRPSSSTSTLLLRRAVQVMFVKALHHHVVTEAPWLQPALKYEQWAAEDRSVGAEDINHNEFRRGRRAAGGGRGAGVAVRRGAWGGPEQSSARHRCAEKATRRGRERQRGACGAAGLLAGEVAASGAAAAVTRARRHMSEVHLEQLIAKGPACFDAELYISAAPAEFAGCGRAAACCALGGMGQTAAGRRCGAACLPAHCALGRAPRLELCAPAPAGCAERRYDAERAWLHFIMFGFREGRPYRFAC